MKIIARYTRDSVWKFPRNSLGFAKSLSNNCRICVESLKIHLPFSYIFTSSSYSCYCIDGYTGRQCQTNWDECWSTPCLNGGTCIDGVASYNCTCSEGFNGMLQFSLSVPANRVALFIFYFPPVSYFLVHPCRCKLRGEFGRMFIESVSKWRHL